MWSSNYLFALQSTGKRIQLKKLTAFSMDISFRGGGELADKKLGQSHILQAGLYRLYLLEQCGRFITSN